MSKKEKEKVESKAQPVPGIQTLNIDDLVFDDRNANKGTDEGAGIISHSISKYGVGRGVLVDKNRKIIAGNHAVREMKAQGIKEIIIVPTTGEQLVVTQRVDILKDSAEGHGLAIADNRATQANLLFDNDVLAELDDEFDIGFEDLKIDTTGTTDDAEQMEEYGGAFDDDEGAPAYEDKDEKLKNNLFPVMAALNKAQRLEFDAMKKKLDCTSDTETIVQMLILLREQPNY